MAARNLAERIAHSRRTLIRVIVGLIVAGALLWALLYALQALHESYMRANERRARQRLATIHHVLQAYFDRYEGYPDSLERLRGGEEGDPETAPPERARLLDSSIALDSFERDGYHFQYRLGPAQQRWAATVRLFADYRLTAEPTSPGTTGEIFYYVDRSGETHARQGEPAGPDDPVVEASPPG